MVKYGHILDNFDVNVYILSTFWYNIVWFWSYFIYN